MNLLVIPFPNNEFQTLSNSKYLQMTNSLLVTMSLSSTIGLKTMWKREKMLVTAIFSFSHIMFSKVLFPNVVKTRVVWGEGMHHRDDLTHYQTTNFRLFQTERVCRRQSQI